MSLPGRRAAPTHYHPLVELFVARLREFCREPSAIFWVYVFPLVMVAALGLAFRTRPAETFVVAIEAGPRAELIRKALGTDSRCSAQVGEPADCRQRLRAGKADLIVAAAEDSHRGYDYFFDPARPGSLLARKVVDDLLQRAAGRRDAAAAHDHEIVEPGSRYIDFLVPGLLGMGLMGGGLWGVGFAIVDMRIRKLLKRYLATPMRRSHFLASIMLSRLAFSFSQVVVLVVFARLVFGVANHGSYLTVGALILLGALEFSGIGLLVASRAETLETVSGLMNLVMLPMWIGSGIFFSIERFPQAMQPVLFALPLTPLIDALRRVMLEGVGVVAIAPHLMLMVAWGAVTSALALRWFRWT